MTHPTITLDVELEHVTRLDYEPLTITGAMDIYVVRCEWDSAAGEYRDRVVTIHVGPDRFGTVVLTRTP